MNDQFPVCFFFGANTPKGFVGFHKTDLYDPRDGWAAFLIKSGAGTGKSSFMRRVYDELQTLGTEAHAIVCSSDPHSLDAVVFPQIKLCVVDATAPHIIEPTAYGECEQLVPFSCAMKAEEALDGAKEWFDVSDSCAAAHARCCRFLAAAAVLLENNRRLQETARLDNKLIAAAERLALRECGGKTTTTGNITRRLLSAVTPEGYLFMKDTPTALCPRLFVIEDEYGAVSSLFLNVLCARATEAGHDVIACVDPLMQDECLEHLLIPSLGVGFITANSRHPIDYPVFRRIHATRFINSDTLKAKKQQLIFNRRAAAELISEAVVASNDAKSHHDRMEAIHSKVMDWITYDTIAEQTLDTIRQIASARMS